MRYFLLNVFLALSFAAGAQNIVGIVTDKITAQPIIGATVNYGRLVTQTNRSGLFELDNVKLNDSLKVSFIGYLTYSAVITTDNTGQHIQLLKKADAFRQADIYGSKSLTQDSIGNLPEYSKGLNNLRKVNELKQVDIYGIKSFTQDSITNRLDYSNGFNYQHPKLTDAIAVNPGTRPGELLTIDLLAIVRALTYKSTNEYKFNKILKRDEHEQYVDEKFNRGIVGQVTGLKGDTLSAFLVVYRPTYDYVLKATPYTMQTYIKDCYKKFEEGGFNVNEMLVTPVKKDSIGMK